MKKTNSMKLLCLVALAAHGTASAATISWSAEGLATGVSTISNVGTLEYAYNNAGATETLGGVTFVGTATGAVSDLAGEGNITVINPDNGLNAGFGTAPGMDAILDTASWAHRNPDGSGLPNSGGTGVRTTIELNNLTIGELYLVQVFSSDTRGTRNSFVAIDKDLASEFVSTIGNGAVSAGGGEGVVLNGEFMADATTQSFTYIHDGLGGNANYNAIQLRNVPEPSVALLGGLGLLGLIRRRR